MFGAMNRPWTPAAPLPTSTGSGFTPEAKTLPGTSDTIKQELPETVERPDLISNADSACRRMSNIYPPLEPRPVESSLAALEASPQVMAEPSSPISRVDTFNLAPSLQSLSVISPIEYNDSDTMQTKDERRPAFVGARAPGINSGPYILSAPSAAVDRTTSTAKGRRFKSGSPIQRKLPLQSQDVKPRGFGKLAFDQGTAPGDNKQKFEPEVSGGYAKQAEDSTTADTGPNIRYQPEVRGLKRSDPFGFGPTVRFAKDAHEVIMGSAPGTTPSNSRTSSNRIAAWRSRPSAGPSTIRAVAPKPDNHTEPPRREGPASRFASTRPTVPRIEINARPEPASRAQPAAFPLPEHPTRSAMSTAAHLARPTASSRARQAEARQSIMNRTRSPVNPRGPPVPPKVPSPQQQNANRTTHVAPTQSRSPILAAGTSRRVFNGPISRIPTPRAPPVPIRTSITTTTIKKGFRSRLTNLLPGRRRQESAQPRAERDGYQQLDSEEAITVVVRKDIYGQPESGEREVVQRNPEVITNHVEPSSRREVHQRNPEPIMIQVEPAHPQEEVVPTEHRQDHGVSRAAEQLAVNAHVRASASIQLDLQQRPPAQAQETVAEKELPTPPQSRNGPAVIGVDAEEARIRAQYSFLMPSDGSSAIEIALNTAQQHLGNAIAAITEKNSEKFRDETSDLINQLATSIQVARDAHVATVALINANQQLLAQNILNSELLSRSMGFITAGIRAWPSNQNAPPPPPAA